MVRNIPCGTFVNESERIACERLRAKLQGADGDWIILSNLSHAQHTGARADEIDLVVIGPPGVCTVEVKHWDAAFLRKDSPTVDHEADRIDAKAKRVAGRLRTGLDVGFVSGKLLLTKGEIRFPSDRRPKPRGIPVFGLPEWQELLNVGGGQRLSPDQIALAARLLGPRVKVALDGDLRRFAGLINLERLSAPADAFHRIYRGQHPTRRDRVILHLYDLSASDDKDALTLARREFDSIQHWQKAQFIPSLLDSFQEAEGYPGELHFFSLVDPAAPSLTERQADPGWDPPARLAYARAAVVALQEFHRPQDPQVGPALHRQLTPRSLRVRHNNQPLFTELNLTRLQDAVTVAPTRLDCGELAHFFAPEVRAGGLGVADTRSDTFGLCASLLLLFDGTDPLSRGIAPVLEAGCAPAPADRSTLDAVAARLAALAAAPEAHTDLAPSLPPAEYWDEDTVVPFQQSRYKILGRLRQGGVGQTFKVVELDQGSDERFGTYVAKLVRHAEDGKAAIHAYRLARAYTTHPHLSAIHEYAAEWEQDRFVALLKWVEGTPLHDLAGVLPILAEDLGEASDETLARRWLHQVCTGLDALHRVGLVHGDVSPRNIIIGGGNAVLTDYDTVARAGQPARGGTLPYASPAVQSRAPIAPADDLYALAASLFQALTERDPFTHGPERRKDLGLCWDGIEGLGCLRPFLDRATDPDPGRRFRDAAEALTILDALEAETADPSSGIPPQPTAAEPPPPPLSANTNPWLDELLRTYPGSRHGVRETRGLDSAFAISTYVETRLDQVLFDDIEAGRVNLVILFGNAGDGKTAFLQHLARRLGLGEIHSSRRVWETDLADGRRLMVNLDGAAAWQGRDANDLLDDLFAPFQVPDFPRDRVHIVAVNNGKLLEWIETRPAETWLTRSLRQVLLFDVPAPEERFRLIDLNRRSLVGGIDANRQGLSADFLGALIDRLVGAQHSPDPWQPCATCTASSRCTAWNSVQTLCDAASGPRLRNRLTELFQACHQRGEVHITARELRAALSYCLFGLDDCPELHQDPDRRPVPFWQRAFDAGSERRQGELLAEMARFDPALEADPAIDRVLLRQDAIVGGPDRLREARRRAWLLRPDPDPNPGPNQDQDDGVRLSHGRHLARFRDLPLLPPSDQDATLRDLCLGIARLEELPALAFAPDNLARGVPLRITPRTPTESAFWVVKPWDWFSLEPALPLAADGLERLHTHLHLIYRYADSSTETLIIGLEIFHLLLELKDGTQLSGVGEEGVFANLEIFTQRLASEDARELHGWHPGDEQGLFRVRVVPREGRQVLVREML